MKTPASIAKHPIHPMLITIPIGLWIFSFVCDLFFVFGNGGENWRVVAFYTMAGGVIGALLAAIPGFIDLLSLPSGVKRIAILHMSINLGIVVLYIINLWLRTRVVETTTPQWLSLISVLALGVSGWLGGKMVHVHGVAVVIPPEPLQASSWSPERRHGDRRVSV
ncbi:MAG TPA: DUF2231 domain-containing protein [Burkholderiaceae bacterium]|nr:DUF2231 domain-containing protein [Burkholderiaceae bacterium]